MHYQPLGLVASFNSIPSAELMIGCCCTFTDDSKEADESYVVSAAV